MRQISQTAMEGFHIVAGGFTPRLARIHIYSSFDTFPGGKDADRGMNAPATRCKPSLAV